MKIKYMFYKSLVTLLLSQWTIAGFFLIARDTLSCIFCSLQSNAFKFMLIKFMSHVMRQMPSLTRRV